MKLLQKISTTSLAAATYVSLAMPVFAQDATAPKVQGAAPAGSMKLDLCSGGNADFCPAAGADAISGLIGRAIIIIFVVAAVLALFYLIWGGIKWILSGGDKTKVEAARSTIIAAIIGLIITFLSYFILQFILSFFNLDLSNLQFPSLIGK